MKIVPYLIYLMTLSTSFCLNARSVYLNGVDISNVKDHELENVSIQINEKGDVFIVAPHYSVNEENTYIPLSKLRKKNEEQGITHKLPGKFASTPINSVENNKQPAESIDESSNSMKNLQQPATVTEKNDPTIEKAGSNQPEATNKK